MQLVCFYYKKFSQFFTVNTFNTYEYSFVFTVIIFQYLHTAEMGNLKN
jgi:hypothetical protein